MEALAVVVGLGLVAVSPFVPGLRPVAKKLVVGGLVVAAVTKNAITATGEQWMDLVAEARAERNPPKPPVIIESVAIPLPPPQAES